MQYKSPVKILKTFLHNSEDLLNLDLGILKRRLLAEFELSGTPTLVTDEGEFSKNDILEIFENFKSTDEFQFHLKIAGYPAFLDFLEYNNPEEVISFETDYFKDEKFLHFISPYLANSIGNFFAGCLHNPQLMIKNIRQKNYPILPEHETYLLQPVYYAIDEIVSEIEEIQKSFPSKARLNEARKYFRHELIRAFLYLPQNYFAVAVNMYAKCGLNFVIDFFEKNEKNITYNDAIRFVYDQISKLPVQPDVKSRMDAISELMNVYHSPEKERSGNTSGSGRMILFIIFAVIAVFRVALSDSSKSRRNNNFDDLIHNQEFWKMQEAIRQKSDSITTIVIPDVEVKPVKSDSARRQRLLKTLDSIKQTHKITDTKQSNTLDTLIKRLSNTAH